MGLDTVELVMWVEEEFDISLSDDEASVVLTVGDLAELIANKVNEKHGKRWTYIDPLPAVIDVLVKDYGVKREKISTASRIVDDLGLD
ncbi:hypothetical protein [Pseudoteredinibacter isoporae]|uniref:Acyl carrier protein n=1 Tax=Pseudoteredinibacter isoporae TaxID=570281 RepID=A0A7X0MVZ4_9GAMM|nr:acyl carrier protein [Pseudoteredinibacter isoporae]NHO87442.1 hypothetical protein [Pseudoteredinibacter isoporae]NIB24227.1 hypothetical protein [Pseudoteredinibacter isoporae]